MDAVTQSLHSAFASFRRNHNMSTERPSPLVLPEDEKRLLSGSLPTVNPAAAQPAKPAVPAALYVIVWIALSSSVILFNKWLLYDRHFPYPIFLTTWHMLFATIATRVLAQTTNLLDGQKRVTMTWSVYVRAILPIGLIFSLSLICGNQAYLYLSVPFIQMLKATTPVAVLLASWSLGLAAPNLKVLANVSVIVFGIVVASYGEIAFSITGFTFQAIGIAFEATRLVLIQRLLSSPEYKMDAIVSLYYYAPVCTAFNLVAFFVFEAGKISMEEIASVGVVILVLNAMVAFALNISVVLLIGKTSSLVLTLCGVLKDIILVVTSVIFWHTTVTFLQLCGYSVALVGLIVYKLGAEQLRDAISQMKSKNRVRLPVPRRALLGGILVLSIIALVSAVGMLHPHPSSLVAASGSLFPGLVGGLMSSSSTKHTEIPQPLLDQAYKPPVQLDIVVSMFRENSTRLGLQLSKIRSLPPIRGLDTRIIIYVKDEKADIESIGQNTGASSVTILPNVGREGGTFLHHIVNEWDHLAAHTIFLQGDIHERRKLMDRITDYFVPDTGMLSLGFGHAACDYDSCADPWSSTDVWKRVPEIYSAVCGELCPKKKILLSYAGQFIASAQRIRGTKKQVYQHLEEVLESDQDHWIHQDYHQEKFHDRPDDPYFGHTIERSWMILMQCADPKLAETCPRLSNRREEGDPADKCQCIDAKGSVLNE